MSNPDLRAPRPRREVRIAQGIIAVGVVIRLGLAGLTSTNGDIENMQRLANWLAASPFRVYRQELTGHPVWPNLSGYFPVVRLARLIETSTGLSFTFQVRLVTIVANLAMAWIVDSELARRGTDGRNRLIVLAGLMLSPLLILESGWHAQLDITATTFAVAAYFAWQRSSGDSRAILAGVLLGVAALIETPVGLAAVAFLPHARGRRELALLVGAIAGTVLLGSGPWLIAEHHALLHQLSTYSGIPGQGGLNLIVQPNFSAFWLSAQIHGANSAFNFLAVHAHTISLVTIVVAAVFVLATRPPIVTGVVLLFLAVYATGVFQSTPYIVWVVPFLAMGGWTRKLTILLVVSAVPTVLQDVPQLNGHFSAYVQTWPVWVDYAIYVPILVALWGWAVISVGGLASATWRAPGSEPNWPGRICGV
jgi:hypothetical protein